LVGGIVAEAGFRLAQADRIAATDHDRVLALVPLGDRTEGGWFHLSISIRIPSL
jgi:hypothetical protein